MIGKHTFEIGAEQFARGVSTGPNINDGGFSNETDAVNLTAVPGALFAPATSVNSDTDTRLTGNLIASCPDMVFVSPDNRLLVSDDGKGYRYNGTKLTAVGVALTAGKTWTAGFTDIATFGGEAYVTSKEGITRWESNDTIDGGADFPFTFTTQNVPHPMLVYENNLYYGDKNLLLIQSAVGVAPTTILTLSADQMIVALGIDPSTGLMLISTKNALDVSGAISTINRILRYDGNSAKVSTTTITEEGVVGFHNVGNYVYVGYGNNIGYFSGAGVQWLRKLNNVTASNTELPYKHHMAHVANTLYVLDGKQVMAFGEITPGKRAWFPVWSNPVNSNKPTMIAEVGAKKIGLAFATSKFYTLDTSSVATIDSMMFFSNKLNFPRPVYIRTLYVEYATAISNNDANRNLYYMTEAQGTGFVLLQDPSTTVSALKNTSGASVYFIELPCTGMLADKVRSLQFRYNVDTVNSGLRRIIGTYDTAE